jgi:hypothetical protein
VIDRADELSISWPLDFGMTDGALEELLFPSDKSATDRRLPDYSYIRKELLRNGVTKKLLWIEYCEECRQAAYGQLRRPAGPHFPASIGRVKRPHWPGRLVKAADSVI